MSSLVVPAAMAIGLVVALAVVLQPAQAQTCKVLHNFTGGADGSQPVAGVTIDKAGNLYGTTSYGGKGYGTAFKLKYTKSGYLYNPLYSFGGGSDGANPSWGVVFGPDGSLYGATTSGGDLSCDNGGSGCGVVFNLKPPVSACKSALCPWVETVLYSFKGGNGDGSDPGGGSNLIFDQAGNIYGTTAWDGAHGMGTVYELTRSGGGWTESILHDFPDTGDCAYDGCLPFHNVAFDKAGNLYGTTAGGGDAGGINGGDGVVFQLAPSGSGWAESLVAQFWNFGTAGGRLEAGLIVDQANNLYGATTSGPSGYAGSVFQLTPSGGGWTLNILYSFIGAGLGGPYGNLVMDSAGNLYGTTYSAPNGLGSIFKLTPNGDGWTFSGYDFPNDGSCGCKPDGDLIMDANGNLYGTGTGCGTYDEGVVFEFIP